MLDLFPDETDPGRPDAGQLDDAGQPNDAEPDATEPEAAGDAAAAFFGRLMGLSKRATKGEGDARARLARLRRCLDRRGVSAEAFREIGDLLPSAEALAEMARSAGVPEPYAADRALQAALLVGALYAVHAAKADEPWYGSYVKAGGTFGASCRAAGDGSGSMEQRFSALLDARREDLPYRLRQAVALCAAKGAGVRYDVLLRDLLRWDAPGRPVQRAWAQAFWAPRTVASPSSSSS